jgi:hypothetical protein
MDELSLGIDRQCEGRAFQAAPLAELNQIQERLLMGSARSLQRNEIRGYRDPPMNLLCLSQHQKRGCRRGPSPQPGAAATLAFYHLVALLQETLAFAVLALLFLLDVGTFVIGHDSESPIDGSMGSLVYTRLAP